MKKQSTGTVFTTGEVARIAGLNHRTVDFWAKTKLIVPSIQDAKGIGTTRLYDYGDLIALRVARELRSNGISTQALRNVVKYLRKEGFPKGFAQCKLLSFGDAVCFVRTCKEAELILGKRGQGVFSFMIHYGRTVEEVEEKIEAISTTAEGRKILRRVS